MEKNKYYNIKEFDYVIDINDYSTLYDNDIIQAQNDYENINEEVILYEKLIELSDAEIEKSKKQDDYNTLLSDKIYFINQLLKLKKISEAKIKTLAVINAKKEYLKKFIENIKYYNLNLDNINKIIKQYNYDIIYNEKNISDLGFIKEFRDNIYEIISYNNQDVKSNIDINILRKYYNSLSSIDAYYTSNVVNNKLKTEDYEINNCDDYIFNYDIDSNSLDYVKDTNDIINIDYILYCEQKSGRRIRKNRTKTHKIKKIRKSSKWDKIKKNLKKNIGKVLAGILVGTTMLGASTFSVGFSTSNNVSTTDSIGNIKYVQRTDDIKVESSTETTKPKVEKPTIKNSNVFNSKKNKNVNEEISIGTKVSASSEIYLTAYNAYNRDESLKPYYSTDDEREVEYIYYANKTGDSVLVTKDNRDKIEELKQLKYYVVSYCLKNVDHDVSEGWYNVNDVKVLVK